MEEKTVLKIALLGRPNTGKSTLLNTLLGYKRVEAGPEAGLTRDSVKVALSFGDCPALLWDTAGIWRKSHQKDQWTRQTEKIALQAVRFAAVVLLVVDGTRPLERGDLQLIQHTVEEGRCLVLVINKTDLITEKERKEILLSLRTLVCSVRYIQPLFISAHKKLGLKKLRDAILESYQKWQKTVPTSKLNACLKNLQIKHPAPLSEGRRLVVKYGVQKKSRPPTFWLFTNRPGDFRHLIRPI